MADFGLVPAFIAAAVAVGFVIGWIVRGGRVKGEKAAMNASWRDQIASQKKELERVVDQNKGLMQQISEFRAGQKSGDARAKELSASLREAFAMRDSMREEKDRAEAQLSELRRDRDEQKARAEEQKSRTREKDDKIFKLSRELESWQNRLPPLLEKFRNRDLEAQQLEIELEKANARLAKLESGDSGSMATQIEPLEESAMVADLDASNEQFDDEQTPSGSANDRNGHAGGAANDSESTGNGTWLEESRADFSVSDDDEIEADEYDDDLAPEESIIEVFEGEIESVEIDEHLEADDDAEPDIDLTGEGTGLSDSVAVDDLQQIKGVGPAIEKTLNSLGIYRYEQIADMSEVDIDRIARELRGFRSRIYREDWMGQARLLENEKSSRSG